MNTMKAKFQPSNKYFFYGTLKPGDIRWPGFLRAVHIFGATSKKEQDKAFSKKYEAEIFKKATNTICPVPGIAEGYLLAYPYGFPAANFVKCGKKIHGHIITVPDSLKDVVYNELCAIEGYNSSPGREAHNLFYPVHVDVTVENGDVVQCVSFAGNLNLLNDNSADRNYPKAKVIKDGNWSHIVHTYGSHNVFWNTKKIEW